MHKFNQTEEIGTGRIEAFSDGVFAIAITLLVLTIHVPQPGELKNTDLWVALISSQSSATYLSFLLSFIIVGVVWANHHTMFSYIKRSNHLLVVLNLLLMLVVVILPFSASLLALYLGKAGQQTAVTVYCGVLVTGGVIYNAPWLYASANHRLIEQNMDERTIRQVTRRYAAGPCLYGVAFILSFFWNGTPGLIACALLALGYLLPTVADRIRPATSVPLKNVSQQARPTPPQTSPAPGAAFPHAEPTEKRRVLLTGAAGGIGSAFFRHAAEAYIFRLADRVAVDIRGEPGQDHETMQLDIADLDACQRACQGIDTVVHLAADPSPEADFSTSLLSNNIQGTYNILRAARDQGCRRVVLASSIQVVLGYAPDVQAHIDSPPRPINMYGVSKCFAEEVASYFARIEGLSCIAVRIGAYDKDNRAEWLHRNIDRTALTGYVSPRDLNQLLTRCVEAPDVSFAIVCGISNNRFKLVDLTSTRDLLGYQPEDDAFEIFEEAFQVSEGISAFIPARGAGNPAGQRVQRPGS